MVDFWMGGVDQRLFGQAQLSHQKKIQKEYPHRDPGSVQQPHPENQVTDMVKKQQHEPWCTV